jgi:hypothetical protein
MFARLAGIDYTACLHVLEVHDGHDVRRFENVRVCVENMCA